MFLVYSDKTTNRVRYAFHLLLKDVLRLKETIEFTSDRDKYEAHNGHGISYSNKSFEKGLNIQPARLLFETGITEQDIHVGEWENETIFFKTSERSNIPFDPFAAAFYLATRYEEYLPYRSDSHQRFSAKDSLAYKEGFLQKAIVNRWAKLLLSKMKEKWPELETNPEGYSYTCTIDIDNAWAYREKGVMRTVGGMGKSFFTLRIRELIERIQVFFGAAADPYDTYDFLLEMKRKHNLTMLYFFLLADYGLNDKNVPVTSAKFQSLVKSLADYAHVGIHPSYGSNSQPEKLAVEVKRLSSITHKEVFRSRQHFLKLAFPETYRRLAALDITEDYTMGYASETGFRSGLCTPYHHYDLDQESLTALKVFPFAVMDGTLNEYLHLSPEKAIERVEELIKEVRLLDGQFISLWHNETLNDRGKWKGWRHVFEKTVEMAV